MLTWYSVAAISCMSNLAELAFSISHQSSWPTNDTGGLVCVFDLLSICRQHLFFQITGDRKDIGVVYKRRG